MKTDVKKFKTPNRQRELRRNAIVKLGQFKKALSHLQSYIISTIEETQNTDFRGTAVFVLGFQSIDELLEIVQGNHDILSEESENETQEAVDKVGER